MLVNIQYWYLIQFIWHKVIQPSFKINFSFSVHIVWVKMFRWIFEILFCLKSISVGNVMISFRRFFVVRYMTIRTTPKPFFFQYLHKLIHIFSVLTCSYINIYKSRIYIFWQQVYFTKNNNSYIFYNIC